VATYARDRLEPFQPGWVEERSVDVKGLGMMRTFLLADPQDP
jgi:hypothetical protein